MKLRDIGVEPGKLDAVGRTLQHHKRLLSAGKCLASARAALKEFGRDSHVFGLTKGQFSMLDLATAMLDITGPAALTAWTWAIADYEAEAVGGFIADGRVTALRMVLDWSAARRNAELVAGLQRQFGLDCVRITKNHAKIVTLATPGADGWKIVIRGSCNLNWNPRFEQCDVSDCPNVFGVVAGMENEIWKRGKPVPVDKLRHADAVNLLHPEEVTATPPAWAELLNTRRWW